MLMENLLDGLLYAASDRLSYVESGAVRSELHFEACDCWLSFLKLGPGPILKVCCVVAATVWSGCSDLALIWFWGLREVTHRVGGCLACDDANRLNAGSILFEPLILFRLADGKQLGFVGDLAE
ncbi:hypothetical protein Nepgr_017426 [Nepenthes gracilis]|uniref:Uncharacterized protein n=1 Tax=Nepenthes gracilis TaxID=150966 RepID=A0AAD3XTC9_NEPGR|nr:hypothetical protein Nepgr_017426 [Nepenthes gracilis]